MRPLFAAATVALSVATYANADDMLRDPVPDTGDEALDLHIHDPSRVMQRGAVEVIAVTGKEQSDDYACGLELWERPAGAAGPWRLSDCLLRDKPAWVAAAVPTNDGAYWAPEFVGSDRIIYSVASDFDDGGHACLGLLTEGGDGVWRDIGVPLSCGGANNESMPEVSIIDPAFFETSRGETFLVTGGGTIHAAPINMAYRDLDLPDMFPGPGWTPLARGPVVDDDAHGWVEASFLHEHEGAYYLFVNWGSCCAGVRSTYEIRVGRSDSPLGPFTDRDGKAMLDGHGTLVLDSAGIMRGPGHASVRAGADDDILSFHYYHADRGGLPWLGEVGLTWDDGWPKAVPFAAD